MYNAFTANGTLSNADKTTCANQAAVSGLLSNATQDLVTCITVNAGDAAAPTDCQLECYNTIIGP